MYGLTLWTSGVLFCALIERNNRFFWSVLGSWGRCYRDHVRPLFLTTDRATLSHQNYVPRELFGILNYVCLKNIFCPWLRFIEHIANVNSFSVYFLTFIYRVTMAIVLAALNWLNSATCCYVVWITGHLFVTWLLALIFRLGDPRETFRFPYL